LNAYLSDRHTPVETLTVGTSDGKGTWTGGEQGTSQQSGQNQGSGGAGEDAASSQLNFAPVRRERTVTSVPLNSLPGGVVASGSGGHISVIA
jgi:hypothetical protein